MAATVVRQIQYPLILVCLPAWGTTYEIQQRRQQLCDTSGKIAVVALKDPKQGREILEKYPEKPEHYVIRAAAITGLNPEPGDSVEDIYRRAWARCMDITEM